jgi:hypothetical protein
MAPSRSAMLLMVASTTPLPAGPPSTTGIFKATPIAAARGSPEIGGTISIPHFL